MVDARVSPVKVPGEAETGAPKVIPTDALMTGVHAALRSASKHKRMVSGAIELKRASAGHRNNPSAYNTGKKMAFRNKPLKVK